MKREEQAEAEKKLEKVANDLKPRLEFPVDSPVRHEDLLAQRPYELSSSADYTDYG